MKKMYLFALASLLSIFTFGQVTIPDETEPNNSFGTANSTNGSYSKFYYASLGGGDTVDYFKPNPVYFGYPNVSYKIQLTVINTGTESASFNFKLYNTSEQIVYDENVSIEEVPAGDTVTREFDVCGQHLDYYYVVFSSHGSFDYNFASYATNVRQDLEPNDTRSQATVFDFEEKIESVIQYTLALGGTVRDEVDYHKVLLGSGDYDLLALNIVADSRSCTDNQWIRYECYKNDELTPFTSGYVGDNNSVNSNYEVKSNISLSGLHEGDYLTFKITASAAFAYSAQVAFKGISGTFGMDDAEPNDDYTQAVTLPENTMKFGNVGYSEYVEDGDYWDNLDEYDTYKITLTQNGDITVYMSSLMLDCGTDNPHSTYFDFLDKDGNTLKWENLILQSSYNGCDWDTVSGSVNIRNLKAGDYYLRIYSSFDYLNDNGAWSNYGLFYKYYASNSPDPEPNDEIEDAVPTVAGTTYNGRVGPWDVDPQDTYQFIMPYAGAANFTINASNDACGGESLLKYYIKDKNGNYVDYGRRIMEWDGSAPCNTLQTVQLKIRALEKDTFYLQLFADDISYGRTGNPTALKAKGPVPAPSEFPVSYSFSYQVVDMAHVDTEPNNDKEHTIPVAPGEVKKGRLGFRGRAYQEDNLDYYSLNVPNAGNIDLIIKSTHRGDNVIDNSGNYGKLISVEAENTSFLNTKAPGYPKTGTIYPDSSYVDTIRICNVGAGPFIIKLQAATSEYQFHFETTDEITDINEIEPNPTKADGQIFRDSSLIKATINYFENGNFDKRDHYKIAINNNDPITIYVKATNTQCAVKPGFSYIAFFGYNAAGTQVISRRIADGLYIQPGETIYDTITFSMPSPDTLFLEWFTGEESVFAYEFFTNAFNPTSQFSITGDTTVCIGSQQYIAKNIDQENLTYHWSLPQGGGSITWEDSVATVTWNQAGTFPVELYLSNSKGNSLTKTQNVIVNDAQPPAAPDIFNFARNLSTSARPPGNSVQWYRNGTPIEGATDSVYYAALAGNYTARFINDCGSGPISNPYNFPADAGMQSITFAHHANMMMSPELRIKLAAIASSGLPVFYSVISGPGTISNDSLLVNGAGQIIVKAEQPGDDEFSAAEEKYDTITVTKGSQVVTFNPVPDQWYRTHRLYPDATSSVGLPVTYLVKSGSATSGGTWINFDGVGSVTIETIQNGNESYNAAATVQQTFCVGIDTLSAIKGSATACLGTYTYTTEKIPGANYVWTLSGGGTIVTNNDTAFVTWTTTGTHTLTVKANSACNPFYGVAPELNITVANVTPTPVQNMLPANGAVGQSLPLALSWVPGQYTETYDLYVWDSASVRPATPYKKDLTAISFTIPQNEFPYNAAYKWQIVSNNPCNQTSGPVQTFRLVPLPDLTVTNVLAPTTAISGQTISITWTVKNEGPGATLATQIWQDNVYLSFDSLPNMEVPPNVNPGGWSTLDLPVRPLLIGSKLNVASLQPGEQYTNTMDFKLPVTYNFPVYIFVQTNRNKTILEAAYDNNKDSAVNPVVITLAPTPDLRVDSVFTPNTVFSGAYINVSYKVKNYGALTPAGAKWMDRIYISQSPLFDSANAIKLKTLGTHGTYYPQVPDAKDTIKTQLQQDSFYTHSIPTVIPNFIFGKWFIHVKTNDDHGLYEGPSFANNVNTNEVQVYLTPTPHLTVNSVTLPVSEASTTQPIGLNWVIKNTGFTDNFEKNQGHYFGRPTGTIPCVIPPQTSKSISARQSSSPEHGRTFNELGGGSTYDSLGQGSSYWLDRVYISNDPSGLDLDNARLLVEYKNGRKQFAGVDFINFIFYCGGYGVANGDHALLPNRTFANSSGFTVPQDLEPGTYYMYVYTNPTKTVFEYPGTPEIKRSAAIVIERPDVMAAINPPANAVAGTPVQIEYIISNNGPGSVYNYKRVDQVYMSANPVFDGTATLVAAKTYTENVLVGTPVTHNVEYTLHPSQSGTRYFFVKTNATKSFAETDTNNNLSTAGVINFAPAAPVDLVVSQISTPDTVLAGINSSVQYTITNNGSGAGVGKAVDSFFVSCSPVFSRATAFCIGKKEKDRNIAPGTSVIDTFSTVLPFTFRLGDCFANDEFNNAFFFVKTNATDSIYEGSNSANNTSGSSQKIIKNMLVDLRVRSVTGQLTAIVGRPYSVSWKIDNIGATPAIGYGYSVDSVFISVDSVLNSNAVPFGGLVWNEKPNIFDNPTYNLSNNFINVPSGDYYVLVKTNTQSPSQIFGERNFSNNINLIRDGMGKAQKISVVRPPLPDLVDSIISYPVKSSPGQPITVIHRIKNIGGGESYPNKFLVQLYLSDDPQGNNFAHVLYSGYKTVTIPAGGFVDDTITVYISKNVTAKNFSLVTSIDDYNSVVETDESNNRTVAFINIFIPEPVDLLITSLQAVDTVLLGYGLDSVRYIIKNNSANPATGYTSDGFYLSNSGVFDSSAKLMGIKNKNIDMQPLGLDTLAFAPVISGVTEGSYNLFVTTDLTNTIPETNETNNTAMVSTLVYVKVKELRLNELEQNMLGGYPRYYKLIIPDSLNGATISVKLVTEDSLTRINQMFIAKGYVPDAAHFDYTYPTANYGNQDLIMAYTTAGTYYISFRCINPGYPAQNITLKARKLPFEISSIQSATGGNIGNVTVKINGSLFTEGMTARLNKSGTEITASKIYYTNTTLVYATFNLHGKPLGVYDLTLSKGDTSFAVLNNGFSVVKADNGGLITGSGPNTGAGDGNEPGCDPGAASGLNSQLVTELIIPEKVFAGWPFVIQINFKNPTNYDIPAQVRTLYAENIIKLGLTPDATINGPHNLTFEITETDGPPGVLRAGGSGTIFIYGRSNDNVPGHTHTLVHFK